MSYHLSEINHNNEVFYPRVPYSIMDDEEYKDQKSKRICFSTTLSGAYRAIQFRPNESMELYVHIPLEIENKIKQIASNDTLTEKRWGQNRLHLFFAIIYAKISEFLKKKNRYLLTNNLIKSFT